MSNVLSSSGNILIKCECVESYLSFERSHCSSTRGYIYRLNVKLMQKNNDFRVPRPPTV